MPGTVAVVGGGAAGFFAAISCAETDPDLRILLLEKSAGVLRKVRVSGGGRCNVTHSCFDPRELVTRYPRGARELLGPFHAWQPRDTIDWFESHGVALKTEADGRMFPISDSSATVIECLTSAAADLGVEVRTQAEVRSAARGSDGRFALESSCAESLGADRLIVASGGGKPSGGLDIARSFGHTVTELAPSLFTFHVDDPRIRGLQGLSVPDVRVACDETSLEQSGPMLITHWGLSGPAILKLSAWGAREFARMGYQFEIRINWMGGASADTAGRALREQKNSAGRQAVGSTPRFDLPRRVWRRLVAAAGIDATTQWAQLGRPQMESLIAQLIDSRMQVTGKSMNKEEFVTCGGVSLPEIDFKRMESKLVPGLHFAGEVLDIDGITGGFNFQAAWTTGRIAGTSAAGSLGPAPTA